MPLLFEGTVIGLGGSAPMMRETEMKIHPHGSMQPMLPMEPLHPYILNESYNSPLDMFNFVGNGSVSNPANLYMPTDDEFIGFLKQHETKPFDYAQPPGLGDPGKNYIRDNYQKMCHHANAVRDFTYLGELTPKVSNLIIQADINPLRHFPIKQTLLSVPLHSHEKFVADLTYCGDLATTPNISQILASESRSAFRMQNEILTINSLQHFDTLNPVYDISHLDPITRYQESESIFTQQPIKLFTVEVSTPFTCGDTLDMTHIGDINRNKHSRHLLLTESPPSFDHASFARDALQRGNEMLSTILGGVQSSGISEPISFYTPKPLPSIDLSPPDLTVGLYKYEPPKLFSDTIGQPKPLLQFGTEKDSSPMGFGIPKHSDWLTKLLGGDR